MDETNKKELPGDAPSQNKQKTITDINNNDLAPTPDTQQIGPDDKYFVSLDKEGNPQRVSLETGEVVPLDRDALTEDNRQKNLLELASAEHLTKKVAWIPRTTSIADIENITKESKPLVFTPQMAEIFISEVINGRTIGSICKDPDFPSYRTVLRWRRDVPNFAKDLDVAKKHRAEVFFDLAVDTVRDLNPGEADKDTMALAKMKSEVFKYAAKIGDQSSFGDKSHITGDVSHGHYMIETGIRRAGDPGFKIDETRKLVEAEDINDLLLGDGAVEINSSGVEKKEPFGETLFGDVPVIPEEASTEEDL